MNVELSVEIEYDVVKFNYFLSNGEWYFFADDTYNFHKAKRNLDTLKIIEDDWKKDKLKKKMFL